jgi:hypothetical protein
VRGACSRFTRQRRGQANIITYFAVPILGGDSIPSRSCNGSRRSYVESEDHQPLSSTHGDGEFCLAQELSRNHAMEIERKDAEPQRGKPQPNENEMLANSNAKKSARNEEFLEIALQSRKGKRQE